MDSKELTNKREELEKKLKRTEAVHYAKPFWHKEGAYQDSILVLKDLEIVRLKRKI